jgi:hypothetical protein
MTSNLKVMLSAVAVAAFAASPATANSYVRSNHFVPADAHASATTPYVAHQRVTPFGAQQLVTPYGADLRERPHEMPGPAADFQLGGEK